MARARRGGFCRGAGRPVSAGRRACACSSPSRPIGGCWPPSRCCKSFDPDADRHLPGGRRGRPRPVAARLARRHRAQRQDDAGAVGRRTGQRADAAAGGSAPAARRRAVACWSRPSITAASAAAMCWPSPTATSRSSPLRRSAGAWQGKSLDELIASGQPLFMFGERAGVMDVRHRRPGLLSRPSKSPTSARRGRGAGRRRTRCSPTGGAPCRSTSRCSC